jgi:hypothetical protein
MHQSLSLLLAHSTAIPRLATGEPDRRPGTAFLAVLANCDRCRRCNYPDTQWQLSPSRLCGWTMHPLHIESCEPPLLLRSTPYQLTAWATDRLGPVHLIPFSNRSQLAANRVSAAGKRSVPGKGILKPETSGLWTRYGKRLWGQRMQYADVADPQPREIRRNSAYGPENGISTRNGWWS